MSDAERKDADFPISAGILFGLGLGGFFDGIVLHQVLQWLTCSPVPAIQPTVCPTLRSTPSAAGFRFTVAACPAES